MRKTNWSVSLGLLLLGCGGPVEEGSFDDGELVKESSQALTTAASRALMITMTSVTNNNTRTIHPCSSAPGDENKAWSIGHLLKREAEKRGVNPQTYVNNWMNAWTTSAVVNGDTVSPALGPSVPHVLGDFLRFDGAAASRRAVLSARHRQSPRPSPAPAAR